MYSDESFSLNRKCQKRGYDDVPRDDYATYARDIEQYWRNEGMRYVEQSLAILRNRKRKRSLERVGEGGGEEAHTSRPKQIDQSH